VAAWPRTRRQELATGLEVCARRRILVYEHLGTSKSGGGTRG
jgi:hypothetical protein